MSAGRTIRSSASSNTAPCIWPDRPTARMAAAGMPARSIAARMTSWLARHQSSGSCSAQPIRGDANGACGWVASASSPPSSAMRSARLPVVPTSSPSRGIGRRREPAEDNTHTLTRPPDSDGIARQVPERPRDRPTGPTRRAVLRAALAAGALAATGPLPAGAATGRLKQSAARWCYRDIALPVLCRAARQMGLQGIDLLTPEEWPVAADHGLVCSMGYGGAGTIENGINDRTQHDAIVRALEQSLPRAAAAGVPNLITFFGNRRGRSDAEGADACVEGLLRIKPMAEQAGVTVCMELLNSKVDHADYQCDRPRGAWKVIDASDRNASSCCTTSTTCRSWRGRHPHDPREHALHRALPHRGVPGRNEIDDAGAELARPCEGHRRHGLQGLRRAGVHPDPRSADVAARGDRDVYGLRVRLRHGAGA
jgi:hydroxypyruvate isomerase